MGVGGEVEIGKSGAFLVLEQVSKDSKLVNVYGKFLVATIGHRTNLIVSHVFAPLPRLLGQWDVSRSIVVVHRRFFKSPYARP